MVQSSDPCSQDFNWEPKGRTTIKGFTTKDLSCSELPNIKRLEKLYLERKNIYELANHKINSNNLYKENIAKKILLPFNTDKKIKNNLIKKGFVLFSIFQETSDIRRDAKKFNCNYFLKNNLIKKI